MAGMILLHQGTKGPEIQHPALPGLGTHRAPNGDRANVQLLRPVLGAMPLPLIPGDSTAFTPSRRCLLPVGIPVNPNLEAR